MTWTIHNIKTYHNCQTPIQTQFLSYKQCLTKLQQSLVYIINIFIFSAKLPKWFGERPGKKAGEPESPDDEDEAAGDAPVDAGDDEEEEEEEEEEE